MKRLTVAPRQLLVGDVIIDEGFLGRPDVRRTVSGCHWAETAARYVVTFYEDTPAQIGSETRLIIDRDEEGDPTPESPPTTRIEAALRGALVQTGESRSGAALYEFDEDDIGDLAACVAVALGVSETAAATAALERAMEAEQNAAQRLEALWDSLGKRAEQAERLEKVRRYALDRQGYRTGTLVSSARVASDLLGLLDD